MPLFTVIGRDVANSLDARLAARAAHLARLHTLQQAGQLVLAGPCPVDHHNPAAGFFGSVIVVDFADRAALDAWLADEPYVHAGVYASVEVLPFRQVLPDHTL